MEIVRVDKKGRILIPSSIRDLIGLREGMHIMLIPDVDKKEVRIVLLAEPEAKLMEFRIEIPDVPGSLARVANLLARDGIDLLATESRTLQRGELAEWRAIADVSKIKRKLDEIIKTLKEEGEAKTVRIREFA